MHAQFHFNMWVHGLFVDDLFVDGGAWPVRALPVRAWPVRAWPVCSWPVRAWPVRAWPVSTWPVRAWPVLEWPVRAWPVRAWPDSTWPVSMFQGPEALAEMKKEHSLATTTWDVLVYNYGIRLQQQSLTCNSALNMLVTAVSFMQLCPQHAAGNCSLFHATLPSTCCR